MNVNMAAVNAVDFMLTETERSPKALPEVQVRLGDIERQPPGFPFFAFQESPPVVA